MDYLKSNSDYAFKKKELASSLRVKSKNYPQFRNKLKSLKQDGLITKVHGGRFIYTSPESYLIGNLSITKTGRGFVDGENKSAFVGSGHFHGALHGDSVKVKIIYDYEGKVNGEIVEILSRANSTIHGFVIKKYNRFILETPFKLSNRKFIIHKICKDQPEDYTWVEAKILEWARPPREIPVEITKIIGDSKNPLMDLKLISSKYSLDLEFPKKVIDEVNSKNYNKIPSQSNRIDLTHLNSITIDPETAKDHDDAISVRKLKNGIEVGIHIADVSEFVIQDSILDKEAFKRGTSIYFPDNCIPMLPEELSNGLCSLKENEDRFAITLLIEVNSKYSIKNYKIVESIINVKKRYSYEDVIELDESDEFFTEIKLLQKLTDYLRKNRFKNGSLNFDIPEPVIIINDTGIPNKINQKIILKSHHLIEELMLLANKIVAKEFGKCFKGFPYRNHEVPKEIDIKEIRQNLLQSNIPTNIKQKLNKKNLSLHKMLSYIKGLKAEKLFAQLSLRAMPKANYNPKNMGHFGLGFKHYCHFTSPIRRYPDLLVHRFLKNMLREKKYNLDNAKNISNECSRLEVNAMNAERDYTKRKQLRYLENFIGDYFTGIISGMNPKGIFIQLDEILVDGFVSVKSLTDDYYVYNASQYSYRGRRYKQEFHIGDQVDVKVIYVNVQQSFADFEMVI